MPGTLPVMQLPSWPRTVRSACVALLAVGACTPAFKLSKFKTNDALYAAATREYKAGRWDNAIQAFERLTLDLPAAKFRAEWVSTKTGNIEKSQVFTNTDAARLFSSPNYLEDIALRVLRAE